MDKFHRLLTFVAITLGFTITLDLSLAFAQAQATQLNWGKVVQGLLKRDKPPLGGRGEVCPISPFHQANQAPVLIWSDRPLFIWQGGSRMIGVRLQGTKTVLWREQVGGERSTLRQVQYSGPVLQPGKTYEWLFFFSQSSTQPNLFVPFQIMDATQQTTIKMHLAKLNIQPETQKINAEALALQRANYFAQRQLWSDVLQEVYSVRNPSKQLQQVARDIEAKVCQGK